MKSEWFTLRLPLGRAQFRERRSLLEKPRPVHQRKVGRCHEHNLLDYQANRMPLGTNASIPCCLRSIDAASDDFRSPTARKGGFRPKLHEVLKAVESAIGLNLEGEHKWVYFHLADLRQMKRTAISVTNSSTNATTSYEGISWISWCLMQGQSMSSRFSRTHGGFEIGESYRAPV